MQAIWHYKQQLRLNSLQSLACTSESLSKVHPSLQFSIALKSGKQKDSS